VRLAQFEALEAEGNVALNAQERGFLTASQLSAAREEEEREMQRQRELEAARQLADTQQRATAQLRRRALFLAGAFVLALAMALVAFYFGDQARQRASGEQEARLKAEQAGRLSSSRELAAAAINNLGVDPERSILLALQAVKVTYDVDKTWTTEAENALHRSVLASHALLTIQAHNAPVWSVALSPDGKRLATASQDGMVKVWDVATGKQLLALQVFSSSTLLKGGVNGVAFSPDGKLLATGSDDAQVRLWDPVTGQLIRTLSGHTDPVLMVSFSPDGTRLGSASADETAKVWDVPTGRELLTLQGHTDSVRSITFSPDNKRISTGSDDGTARIWDGKTGNELLKIQDLGPGIMSPDGTKVATFRNVWDAATGNQLVGFNGPINGHTNLVYNEAYSPDGAHIATVSRDRTAKVWDATTGDILFTLWGHAASIYAVAFSPDGTRLATGDESGIVKIWYLGPDRELLSIQFGTGGLQDTNFMPDRSRLFTAVNHGDVSNPAKVDVSSQVKVFDATTGQAMLTIPVGPPIWELALSPDGKLLATGGAGGATRVWDATTGHELFRLNDPTITTYGITFSKDGKRIATGDSDAARVWDASTGAMLLTLKGHSDEVWGVAFSPDGKRLATASLDSTARVWDLATGRTVLTLTNHTDGVYGIAYSPDGTRLATASRDGTAKIWDAGTGQELSTLKGHTSTLTRVAFSPDGKRLVSASQDRTIKFWDVATGAQSLTLPGTASVAFSPDGTRLATIGPEDNDVRIYTLRIEDLVALAKSRLTRTWTLDECRRFLHMDQCPP
jgi:WD40 repeat protein